MKSFAILLALLFACTSSPDASSREDLATIDRFCETLAETICASIGDSPECRDELGSDCLRNANARAPGAYTAAAGAACLEDLEQIDFEQPPLHCGNLAVASCDDYLDQRSTVPCS